MLSNACYWQIAGAHKQHERPETELPAPQVDMARSSSAGHARLRCSQQGLRVQALHASHADMSVGQPLLCEWFSLPGSNCSEAVPGHQGCASNTTGEFGLHKLSGPCPLTVLTGPQRPGRSYLPGAVAGV